MQVKALSFCLIVILVVVPFPYSMIEQAHAENGIKSSTVISSVGSAMNWTAFWSLFQTYATWSLEWLNGSVWTSVQDDLTIQRHYPAPHYCKFTLIFDASHSGSYRLTFTINQVVNESSEQAYQYNLTYDDVRITFDWSDCIAISGLQFTHGVQDGMFWFRIRRDNVPLGMHIEIDPATIATTNSTDAASYPMQRKMFYTATRYWAFYWNNGIVYYESTTDKTNWSGAATSIGTAAVNQWSIHFDGTYVHYARHETTYYVLYYRRGTPQSDGTINWSADEQIVYDGTSTDYYGYPCITVDTNGYAWIGTRQHPSSTKYYPYIFKNANNDGTWSTDSSVSKALSSTNQPWLVQPIALTSGKVYVIYGYGGGTPKGQLYNSGWGSEETDLADYNIQNPYSFCGVAQSDDVHFTYTRATTYQIRYNKRTYGTGWGTNDVLVQDSVESTTAPALSINTANNNLYCFWISMTTDHVYYKKCASGSWDASATDWINESTDTIANSYSLASYMQDYNSELGLMYVSGASSPYNIRCAYLSLGGGGTPYYAYLTQAITSSWTVAIATTFISNLVQTLTSTWTTAIASTFIANVTQTLTSTWTIILQSTFIADLSQSLTSSWIVAVVFTSIVNLTQTLTSVWTASIATTFKVDLTQAVTSSWLTSLAWTAIADLTQSLATSWVVTAILIYIVNLTQAVTSAWQTAVKSTFNANLTQLLSTSWLASLQSVFSAALTQTISTIWTIAVGFYYAISLVQSIVTSWATTITHLLGVQLPSEDLFPPPSIKQIVTLPIAPEFPILGILTIVSLYVLSHTKIKKQRLRKINKRLKKRLKKPFD